MLRKKWAAPWISGWQKCLQRVGRRRFIVLICICAVLFTVKNITLFRQVKPGKIPAIEHELRATSILGNQSLRAKPDPPPNRAEQANVGQLAHNSSGDDNITISYSTEYLTGRPTHSWGENLWNPDVNESMQWRHAKDSSSKGIESDQTVDLRFARACLTRKSILLIGDSLTRYQYLSLVYFLATGSWSSPVPHNEREKAHASWTAFYETTTQRMQYERCDCYRRNGTGLSHIVENRYFSMNNSNITYLQYFTATNGIRFHDPLWLIAGCGPTANASCQTGCRPGYCAQEIGKFIRLGDVLVPGVLRQVVQMLAATDVILNSGLHHRGGWLGKHDRATALGTISQDVQSKFPSRKIQFHWKTTTKTKKGNNIREEMHAARTLRVEYGWKVFDAWTLAKKLRAKSQASMYWDGVHFEPWVYGHLNRALLMHLCDDVSNF